MLNHLKLKHPSDFSETPEKAKQSSMNEFVNSLRSRRFSSSQSELITNAIVDMIVLDYLPLHCRGTRIYKIDDNICSRV